MFRWNRITNALIALFFVQCLILPIANAGLISTKQEIEIGQSGAKEVEKQFKLLDDPVLQARVAEIGNRIVAVCDRPDLPYSFKVLDVDEVNAFALPGGPIYVYKGLIDLMPTDDELAGIISHEVGHVVKRHSMAQYEKTLGMALIFAGVFGDRGLALQGAVMSAISAGYSRSDERQADKLGYEQSVRAGFNQYGMLIGLMKLYGLNPDQKSSLFSDHPDTEDRIRLVKEYLNANAIRPAAVLGQDGKSAKVVDGDWALPEIRVSIGKSEPMHRAYLVAGRLSNVTKIPGYSPDQYILDSDGTNLTIYYGDQPVVTLTPQDADAAGMEIGALKDRFIEALRKWPAGDKPAKSSAEAAA